MPSPHLSAASELLGPTGPFAKHLGNYEARVGQQEVAGSVARLLERDGILLCEAGTGIGKTFAYLVPALLSGRKVVISTATRNLQDQIAGRDLPRALHILGLPVETTVMKGLSNYFCRRRHAEFQLSQEAIRPLHHGPLLTIQDWLGHTETGDLAELVTISENSPTRLQIASSSDTRLGPPCPYHRDCFVTKMKEEAEAAQVVIVNHHLFFADLALRGPHPGRVLPDYDCVILDEAHQIEDTAATFFGVRVSNSQLSRLLTEAERLLPRATTPKAVDTALRAIFDRLTDLSASGRAIVTEEHWQGPMRDAYLSLDGRLDDLEASLRSQADTEGDLTKRDRLEHLAKRTAKQRKNLEQIADDQKGCVTWVERNNAQIALSSTPVDLSQLLRERLFEQTPAVALLSATLKTDAGTKGFEFVRSRLGIDETLRTEELSVSSPFNYEQQCLLYVPRDLPSPSAAEFRKRAAERTAELVEITDGGAFVLTTSVFSMNALYKALVTLLPERTIWMQGQKPKDALLSAFRAQRDGVLVATSSFWQGVDVPGEALRLLVLEKVPFAVPQDPLFRARSDALEAQGKSGFAHLAIPQAAITLKQGFGRLIRRRDDHGVVALLDERIHSKSYGRRLLAALPPARQERELSGVRAFVQAWQRDRQGDHLSGRKPRTL